LHTQYVKNILVNNLLIAGLGKVEELEVYIVEDRDILKQREHIVCDVVHVGRV